MLSDPELVRRCVAVRERNGWPVAKGPGEINTDYIEGMDPDGTPNQNRKNAFDDLHVVYTFRNGVPVLLAKAECTTQPGARYTLKPINPNGAAIIALGYQECWVPGLHRGNYPALVQTGGACRVYRDRNKTYTRQGESKPGWYGINQHHAYDAPHSDIGGHSAGCLVTRRVADHERMLKIKKSDPRRVRDPKFVFDACVMTAAWVTGIGDQEARPRPDIKPDMPPAVKAGGGAATGLGGLGTYFVDHWMWFALAAVLILVGLFAVYWREPFGEPDPQKPAGE